MGGKEPNWMTDDNWITKEEGLIREDYAIKENMFIHYESDFSNLIYRTGVYDHKNNKLQNCI